MTEEPKGCARVTGSVANDKLENQQQSERFTDEKEMTMTAQVGQKAPEFEAPTYYKDEFTTVKLSDFAGKWVLVCFYPGDFTFV